jgi:rhodanese-related sulfurtransferase
MLKPFVLLLYLILFALQANASEVISVQQAYKLSETGQVLLVDIRSEKEWLETGVAPSAVTISMHQQGGLDAFSDQLSSLLDGNKTKPIALICAGGVRSDRVQQYLLSKGYTNVANVKEGMLGGWFNQGWLDQRLPVKSYKNQIIKE